MEPFLRDEHKKVKARVGLRAVRGGGEGQHRLWVALLVARGPQRSREPVRAWGHGSVGDSAVTDRAEKAEDLMIFGITPHILPGFGGGEGGWTRGRRGSSG